MAHRYYITAVFQSSPGLMAGRYLVRGELSRANCYVSILARLNGRALLDCQAHFRESRRWFQSSPGLMAGRYLVVVVGVGFLGQVSILARLNGRALPTLRLYTALDS